MRKWSGNRYRRKQIIFRVLTAVVFFVLLGGLLESVRLVQLYFEERNLREEIVRLQAENGPLEEEKRRLIKDPQEIERRAREELGMIREGDTVFRIIRPRPDGERDGDREDSISLDRSGRVN
ncbi:MAG: hypothetical protein A2Z06_03610 [Candidatus Glassbacteria bacterium RBG_16_58_8]|uniref:Cell division protein FtsB n=1 Tax=Candidatus Glassbacteria bacterium RBG_16_58_8 TaxID=1817866 RepID=A0A1F5YCB5_9BACT|nr:MAG: hypothetical protein A2Z06_03610 [Candidatus Glassbacteria bacterium RBG_16_58_8]